MPRGSMGEAKDERGKVGHWLSIVQSRLRSRPGHYGGIFQPTGPGSAAPTIGVNLPSGPLS
ncbi:hypothetical protein, partial [Ferrimicrobium acidiphilum]|uniref:hypothetical protein n=1 Tax=Ferrimicrobium acidiphilum TaxID=121039 RepID=UPI0023F00419